MFRTWSRVIVMERRSERRHRLALGAVIYIAGLPAYAGQLRDLSAHGAYVQLHGGSVAPGQSLALDLRRRDERALLPPLCATVVRRDEDGLALRFDRPIEGLDAWIGHPDSALPGRRLA